MTRAVDVAIQNEGTIFLFHPLTKQARAWMKENVAEDAQYLGNSLAVEHRYAFPLAQGMQADGLIVAPMKRGAQA